MIKKIILLSIFFIPLYSYSQSKIEIEKRVKKQNVPLPAQKFVDSLSFSSKVKWFIEQDYTQKTYEAKTKEKGKKYSIEFDSLGQIEDIEVAIKWKDIPLSTQKNICEKLKMNFEKHKIKKIQIQYTGKENDLLNLKTNTENLTVKYEVVIRGRKDTKEAFYEYLFSESGELEEKTQIDFRNTDHLDY